MASNASNLRRGKTLASTTARVFSQEETVAIEALKAYAPNAIKINPWKTISNFLDSTLVMLEWYDGNFEQSLHRDCCVLVRGNNLTTHQ